MAERLHLTIGEVLSLLQQEFPDVSISKIRFLESQGLVDPERTPSGYRKFYDHDVERLRWILRQQREHFLPLKVIRGRLEGEDGDPTGAHLPGDPVPASAVGPTAQSTGAAAQVAATPVPAPAAEERPGPERPAPQPAAEVPAIVPGSAPTPPIPATRSETGSPEATPPETTPPDAAPPDAKPAGTPSAEHPPTRNGAAPAAEADAPRPAAERPETEPEPDPAGRGRATAAAATARAGTRRRESSGGHPDVYTVGELAHQAGCDAKLITDLVQFGILSAGTNVGGVPYFDPSAVELAKIGARFAELGVEPRHLRTWRNAADREAGLFEQLVMPLLRQRNPQARSQAAERLDELTRLGGELRAGLVSEAVRQIR